MTENPELKNVGPAPEMSLDLWREARRAEAKLAPGKRSDSGNDKICEVRTNPNEIAPAGRVVGEGD